MELIEDKGNQDGKHILKNEYWYSAGIKVTRFPLPVGDYVAVNDRISEMLDRKKARGITPKKMDFLGTYDICVDSKNSIQELVGDICGKDHERFRDEAKLAQNNNIKLIVLVENDYQLVYQRKGLTIENHTIYSVDDLHKWVNPRLWIFRNGKQKYPRATKGITLQKACHTMHEKYGVDFMFCSSQESGKKITELLCQTLNG